LDKQQSIVVEIEKQFSHFDDAVAGLQRVKANLKRARGLQQAVLAKSFQVSPL